MYLQAMIFTEGLRIILFMELISFCPKLIPCLNIPGSPRKSTLLYSLNLFPSSVSLQSFRCTFYTYSELLVHPSPPSSSPFQYLLFYFNSFPLFPFLICFSNIVFLKFHHSLASFHQSMLDINYGRLAEQGGLKHYAVVFWLSSVDSAPTKGGTEKICKPVRDTNSGLQPTVHIHPLTCDQGCDYTSIAAGNGDFHSPKWEFHWQKDFTKVQIPC